VRLYVNLGRRDGIDDAGLATFLREKGVNADSVELRNSHTYLIVAEAAENEILTALAGATLGTRDVVVERARG
jgi:hypothetical protein